MLDTKFNVYVCGEIERKTDFLGLLNLLANYSDFFRFTTKEQNQYFKNSFGESSFYIDANITCIPIKNRLAH